MDIAFYKELEDYEEAFGVIGEYQTCTGWCDIHASKTIVENPKMELKVLESLDVEKGLEQYFQELGDEYKADIIRVYDIILDFFRRAEGTMYIEEE